MTSPWTMTGLPLRQWSRPTTAFYAIHDKRKALRILALLQLDMDSESAPDSINFEYADTVSLRTALKLAPIPPDPNILLIFHIAELLHHYISVHIVNLRDEYLPDSKNNDNGAVQSQAVSRLALLLCTYSLLDPDALSRPEDEAKRLLALAAQWATTPAVKLLARRDENLPIPEDSWLRALDDYTFAVINTISIIYAVMTSLLESEQHVGALRINATQQTAEHLRRLALVYGSPTQEEMDLITCHESFDPSRSLSTAWNHHDKLISMDFATHPLSDTLSRYVSHILNQVPPQATPPRYAGELMIPDTADFDALRQANSIRIVLMPNGIWCSVVHDIAACAWHAFHWSPAQPSVPGLISERFSIQLAILLPGVWRDACLVRDKALKVEKVPTTREYPQPETFKRRRVRYLPRIRWGTPAEHQRIRERTQRLQARHTVHGFVRTLHGHPDYVPPDAVIQRAFDDADDGADAKLPGIGQTYVRTHKRGDGEPCLTNDTDLIVCQGLVQAMAILRRETAHWPSDVISTESDK